MLLRSLLYYGPAIFFPRFAAFALVILLTHALPAAQFGYYALVLVVGEILDMSCSNWLRLALLRLDGGREGAWIAAIRRSIGLSLISTMLAIVVGAPVAALLIAPAAPISFFLATAVYVASNSLLRLGLTGLQIRRRKGLYAVIEGARAAALFTSTWALTVQGVRDYATITYANGVVAGAAAATAIGLALLGRSGAAATEAPAPLGDRIRFGAPVVILTLIAYVVTSSDRLALQHLSGAAQVGAYAAAYALARQPIDILANAVNQGGFPELVHRYENGGAPAASAFLGSTFGFMTLLLLSAMAAVVGLSKPISAAFLPDHYQLAAAGLMPPIAAATVLLNLKTFVFDNIFHLVRKNWLQVLSFVPAGLGVVAACALLIPRLGAQGAAWALLIGTILGLLGSILMSRQHLAVHVDAFDLAKCLVIAAASAGAMLLLLHRLEAEPAFTQLGLAAALGLVSWTVLLLLMRPTVVTTVIRRVAARTRSRVGGR